MKYRVGFPISSSSPNPFFALLPGFYPTCPPFVTSCFVLLGEHLFDFTACSLSDDRPMSRKFGHYGILSRIILKVTMLKAKGTVLHLLLDKSLSNRYKICMAQCLCPHFLFCFYFIFITADQNEKKFIFLSM